MALVHDVVRMCDAIEALDSRFEVDLWWIQPVQMRLRDFAIDLSGKIYFLDLPDLHFEFFGMHSAPASVHSRSRPRYPSRLKRV